MVPVEIIMTDDKRNADNEHRAMDGLTEVLRLQAEALSRISERMAGMRGAPPDSTPIQVPPPFQPGVGRESGNLPVLAHDPALNEESLPVLNSFKNFLDQERRRTRKRLLWVLLGFTMVFSGVVVVIVWQNSESAQEIKADIAKTSNLAKQSRLETQAEIQRLGEQASVTATQNVSQMRKDIARNIVWAHSVIASNVSSELSGRDSEAERLKEKISSIEIENAMLSRRVVELGLRVSALEDRDRVSADLEAQAQESFPRTNTPSASAKPAPVIINSPKYGRSFQLRMPQE